MRLDRPPCRDLATFMLATVKQILADIHVIFVAAIRQPGEMSLRHV